MPIISDLFDFHKCYYELADAFVQARFGTEENQFLEGHNRHQQLAQKLKPELGTLKLLLVKRILEEPHAARFADEIPDIVDNFIALVNSSPHPLAPLDICDPDDSGTRLHFHNRDAELLDRASLSLNRLDHIMMFCTGEQAPRETSQAEPAKQPHEVRPKKSHGKGDAPANGPAPALPDAQGSESKVIRKKQSHNQDDAKDKLIAALTKHHKYADGSCLNTEPIGNNELARLAEVSNGTVSKFFKDKFEGYTNYKQYCRNTSTLIASLKLLNDEYSPYLFLGKGAARIPAPTEGDD